MNFRRIVLALITAIILAIACLIYLHQRSIHAVSQNDFDSSPLPDDVYIWQRVWTAPLAQAVQSEHTPFHRIELLAAEISLKDNSAVTVKPDWASLKSSVDEVGLVIRAGPISATRATEAFQEDSPQIQLICRCATSAIAQARDNGLKVAELQIDFDCADSKLPGYQKWVIAIKSAVAPVPVYITVLPSWLKRPEFTPLARQADGFILQVHSLHRPTAPDDPMLLCDATEAKTAITDACKAGVKFRLALPTYSYVAGFSHDRQFLGLAGEGAHPAWPDNAIVKTMRSDPAIIANLVADLTQRHPALLTGIIWYRLPVSTDTLNWRMPTLTSVMAGRVPQGKLESRAIPSTQGATDIYITNTGNADACALCQISAQWPNAKLIAADGINAFDHLDAGPNCVKFRAPPALSEKWISPGDRLQIGWLRLSPDTEVQTHVEPLTENPDKN